MQPERWPEVKALFDAVADLDAAERSRLLEASDPDIRREVERLLAYADSAGDFLQDPVLPANELFDLSEAEAGAFENEQVLLQRFRIIRLVGRGGMGEVYEAFDNQLAERVAIKTIRRELAADSATRERFRREVQHSRKVTHPNVCRIYDLFTIESDDGLQLPFFTMELLSGSTLRERIRTDGALPLSVAADVAFQICSGLSCAHKSGVIHRDLKSGNVLIAPAAGVSVTERAVITDFGLAQIEATHDAGEQTRTTTRGLAGTPAYIAPELLEGRPATAACDIYALGVLLYEMVTGKYPFLADSELVALTMRLKVPPRPPRDLAPNLPSHWEQAILGCLAVSPENRIGSADEVAAVLSGSTAARLRARLRASQPGRRRLLASVGGAACLGLVSIGVWRFFGSRSERIRLLVEEFDAPADQAALGHAARHLVRTALAQSPRIHLMHDDAVRVEMERAHALSGKLSGETAFNIARVAGASFTVGARLEQQVSGTALSLWLTDVASGRRISLGTGDVSGLGLEDAIDRLCIQLRRALDEDEQSIRVHRSPLERADTTNLAALELFTRALECYHQGDTEPALQLLESATREDPEFAMAHVYQALIHSSLRREDRALAPAVRAFELRHRVNERQRLQAESLYHTMTGDYERASTLNRVLAEHYPDEAKVQRHAAHTYALLDRLDEARKFAHRAVELNPQNPSNHVMLAGVLAQAHEPDLAIKAVQAAARQLGQHPLWDSGMGFALLVKGDIQAALSAFTKLAQERPDLKKMARGYRERCLILAGRLEEAKEDLASQLSVDDSQQDYSYGDLRRCWLGQLLAVAGDYPKAAEVARGLCERSPIPPFLFALRSAAEIAFEAKDERILNEATARAERIQNQYPSGRSQGIYYQLRGLSAALSGDSKSARRDLVSAQNAWPDVNSSFFAAEILFQAGARRQSADLYERVVSAKGSALRREGVVLWVRSLAGAGLSACDLKQPGIALQRLEQFLQHWGNDPKLPIVKQVRMQAPGCGQA